jgi:gamma-glutamyl-gamma-aminobutyrate hydrolase PuuD
MSQQPSMFTGSMSSKTVGNTGRAIDNQTFQFPDSAILSSQIMHKNHNRQPSAKTRQNAMKTKQRIYAKRNINENQMTTSVSRHQQSTKLMGNSLTRDG